MGPEHRVAAVAAWLGVAPHLGVTPGQLVVGTLFAGAAGHGRLSPDADQEGWLAKLIPGGHRGITHWWPVTLVMFLAGTRLGTYGWQVEAVAVAWASHLGGDVVFGEIPVLPRRGGRWVRFGVGLDTGGWSERWVARPLLLLTVLALALVDAGVIPSAWWLHPHPSI